LVGAKVLVSCRKPPTAMRVMYQGLSQCLLRSTLDEA
jgi:hypothetical protein